MKQPYLKPIVVNAFRLGYQEFPGWFCCEDPHSIHQNLKAIMFSDENGIEAIIKTPEGEMKACYGDYIVRGIEGEIYPVKATIFEKTYERLDCYGDYTVRGIEGEIYPVKADIFEKTYERVEDDAKV